jgi:predicted HD phosphohydrolase
MFTMSEVVVLCNKADFVPQGGPFTDEQVKDAQKDPLLQQKLSVRRWDDLAKVPDKVVPGLDAYEEMAVQALLNPI